MLNTEGGLGVKDDYHYWRLTGFRGRGGKLFYLDPQDRDTLQIFFDDNISSDSDYFSIVDVRDIRTGHHIPYHEAEGKYHFGVKPHEAILDIDYFLKRIN